MTQDEIQKRIKNLEFEIDKQTSIGADAEIMKESTYAMMISGAFMGYTTSAAERLIDILYDNEGIAKAVHSLCQHYNSICQKRDRNVIKMELEIKRLKEEVNENMESK